MVAGPSLPSMTPLEPEGATAPKVKFGLGATRVGLPASQVDAVPITPRCLTETTDPEPLNMPKPADEGGP